MADIGQDQLNDSTDTALDRLVAEVSDTPEAKTEQIDPNDADAVEEAAARKALADEEAAAAAPAVGKTEEGKEPAEAAKADDKQADRGKGPVIPKAAFDERIDKERQKTAEATAAAAYWKGVADAQRAGAVKTDEPEKPTPEQQIANIRGEIKNLAKKVDAGELLMSDFEDKRQELLDQELVIRDTLRKPTEAQPPKRGSDLYLEQKTAELEANHLYVNELSPDDLALLTKKAVASLEAEGTKLPKGDLDGMDLLILRTRIAELSDRYGPVMTGKELKKPETATAGKPGLSKEAKQREEKLAAAASAPPDLTAAGRSTSAIADYSESQIMAMSEEQIEALPQSVRDKIMGRLNA